MHLQLLQHALFSMCGEEIGKQCLWNVFELCMKSSYLH